MGTASQTDPVRDYDDRLGPGRTRLRQLREQRLWTKKHRRQFAWYHPARYFSMRRVVPLLLRLLERWDRAHGEFLNVRVVENVVELRNLPPAFDGFRLLQLSDLHLDIDPKLVDAIREAVRRAEFDRAVVTGDFHNEIGLDFSESMRLTAELIPELGSDPLGILGNHDRLEMVPILEAAGLRMLLNENVGVERGGQRIWICGIDDNGFFRTHDYGRAREGVPEDGCAVLLAHSPERFREAAAEGYALQLCGHTHGGQICLPGGRAILRKAAVPGDLISGRWERDGMPGYTSPGTGSCTAAARLNCPPEITVHILRFVP